MGFLIDSNVFIAAARGRFSLPMLTAEFGNAPMALSAITASELLHGIHRAIDPKIAQKRQDLVEQILNHFTIIPFDLEFARSHAQLFAMLVLQLQIIGPGGGRGAAAARAGGGGGGAGEGRE